MTTDGRSGRSYAASPDMEQDAVAAVTEPRPRAKAPVRLALAGIVLLGACVRFWGLWYGLPHPLARPDEEIVVGHAMELSIGGVADRAAFPYPELLYFTDPVRGRAIHPEFSWAYPYPSLVYDAQALVLAGWRKTGEWLGAYGSTDDFIQDVAVRRPGLQYRIGRVLGALAGTATVLATFVVALHGYRRRSVALLAALLVAVNFLHARDSHYATVDAPMTLLVTIALSYALKAEATGRRRDVLLSAGFAGLAASAKFNGAIVIASTVVAAGRRFLVAVSARRRWKIVVTLALAAAVMIAAFAVTSPSCIRYYRSVHFGLRTQRRVLFDTVGAPAWQVFLGGTLPEAFGWAGFVAVAAGLLRALWKRRPADLILLAFIVPAFASMAGMTWVLPRYPLPLIPALSVLAAEACMAALPARRTIWIVVLLVALTAQPLASILAYDRLASRPDTRLQASAWAAAHLPPEARVLVCWGYGAPIIQAGGRTPTAGRRATVPCTLATVRATGARYVVTHAHPYIAFFALPEETRQWLVDHARVIATFTPFRSERQMDSCFYPGDAFYLPSCGFGNVQRGGPIVTIWDLQPPAAATPVSARDQ